MEGLSKTEKRRFQAEDLFINHGMLAKEIAAIVGVSEQTISKYRKSYNWDDRRADALSSPAKIKEILTSELLSVSSGNKPKIDCDALSKIAKVRREMSGNIDGGTILNVLKECDNWLAGVDPKAAPTVAGYHKQFLQHKAATA